MASRCRWGCCVAVSMRRRVAGNRRRTRNPATALTSVKIMHDAAFDRRFARYRAGARGNELARRFFLATLIGRPLSSSCSTSSAAWTADKVLVRVKQGPHVSPRAHRSCLSTLRNGVAVGHVEIEIDRVSEQRKPSRATRPACTGRVSVVKTVRQSQAQSLLQHPYQHQNLRHSRRSMSAEPRRLCGRASGRVVSAHQPRRRAAPRQPSRATGTTCVAGASRTCSACSSPVAAPNISRSTPPTVVQRALTG